MKNKKIILDTNLWSSFLISNDFVEIDNLVQEKEVTFLFSEESLKEFIEVVERPKFKNSSPERCGKALVSLINMQH